MKRILIFLLLPMAAIFGRCAPDVPEPETGRLAVTFDVDDIATASRGMIPAQEGETTVKNLRLLFFEHEPDASGRFVKSLSFADAAMNWQHNITFDGDIVESRSYTILAVANAPEGEYNGLTERQAINSMKAQVSGVGTDEKNNSSAIDPAALIMTARVVRAARQNAVTINLTRAVVRFDVENAVRSEYDLVSASIWGAVTESPLWHDRVIPSAPRTERFYGITRQSGFDDIERGLYAFGNYVANPQLTDRITTCLILGLKPAGYDLSQTTYYRVNVNHDESPQNLVRNHVYRIRIEKVVGLGADTEYDAWTKASARLKVSIDGWNSDDGGMIKTDGQNVLIMPVKRVGLDGAGDEREYSIFTKGNGILTVSKSRLPEGIDVELRGNILSVKASGLPKDLAERRGSVEVSYAGLRGEILFVQSADNSRFLTLNRYEIPDFDPVGRTWIKDKIPFTVSASGAWKATIYNLSEDGDNPGFSFEKSGAPVTVLRSSNNPYGNAFQIYTTGSNPEPDKARHGFMVVSLNNGDDSFDRVVVLTQAAGR